MVYRIAAITSISMQKSAAHFRETQRWGPYRRTEIDWRCQRQKMETSTCNLSLIALPRLNGDIPVHWQGSHK